jgi:hypothetical protein
MLTGARYTRILALIALGFQLGACSVYESGGRKTLEKQAFEIAGVGAQENLTACGYTPAKAGHWMLIQTTDEAKLYAREADTYELRVTAKSTGPNIACLFHFSSAQELYQRSQSALELTLLHLSPGQFAFPTDSHLK